MDSTTLMILGITLAICIVIALIWFIYYLVSNRNSFKPKIVHESQLNKEPSPTYNNPTITTPRNNKFSILNDHPYITAKEKFAALRFLAGVIRVIAILSTLSGYVFSITLLAGGSFLDSLSQIPASFTGLGFVGFALGVLFSTTFGVLIYAYGDFIQCIIDIEHNTRQTALNTGSIEE